MKVTILGSGGWEGIPSPFCKCIVCQKAADNPTSKDNRTRPEILVESEEGKFLIEISPDIRLQSTRFNLPLIKDFLVSHWHFDHLYGILELSAWSKFIMNQEFNIFCSEETNKWIDMNFKHVPKNVTVVQPYVDFSLSGIKVTPVPVYHMRTRDENLQEDELSNTFGYILQDGSRKIVYLADYFKIPQKTADLIKGADVLIADGTYLLENIFPDKPTQNYLKSDADHVHGQEIFDYLDKLEVKEVVFHSTTHLTEKTHDEIQGMLPANFKISYDGMVL